MASLMKKHDSTMQAGRMGPECYRFMKNILRSDISITQLSNLLKTT